MVDHFSFETHGDLGIPILRNPSRPTTIQVARHLGQVLAALLPGSSQPQQATDGLAGHLKALMAGVGYYGKHAFVEGYNVMTMMMFIIISALVVVTIIVIVSYWCLVAMDGSF